MAFILRFVKMINKPPQVVSHDRQDMTSEDKFSEALEKYVVNVTPHLEEFLGEVYMLPETQNLSLAMRTVLFGVIGRFHHEMKKGIEEMHLHPIESYAFAIREVVNDPHVNSLMTKMMSTGVNAAVNNVLEM